jgi:dTMP kinase
MKKGKFIVIDGTDGSGKATQTKLLVDRLKKEKYKVKTIDFPQYERNFFGKLIGECLAGKHGNFLSVNPRVASVIYAADRWESGEKIKKWLMGGYLVIADRYTSSNQIHQGSKIKNNSEMAKFLAWLEQLEFDVFQIPRPNLIVYLDVAVDITLKLLKNNNSKKRKNYMGKNGDLAENNPKHLNDSRNNAVKLVRKFNNWEKINCMKNGKLMAISKINDIIFSKIKKIL